MSQEDEKIAALEEFARQLVAALTLDLTVGTGCDVDVEAVLDLAGVAAHTVMRPAAPLTTYLVGFAAGRASATSAPDHADAPGTAAEAAFAAAAGNSAAAPAAAFAAASHTARQVAGDHQTAAGSA